MLKKEITYTNFNDEDITVTEYFNLNKVQTMKLVSGHGGMDKYLQSIIDEKNGEKFIDFVEELVYSSYGKRDPENAENFITTNEVKDAFAKTGAYDELVYTLLSNEKEFEAFFIGILPKAMQETVRNAEKPQIEASV